MEKQQKALLSTEVNTEIELTNSYENHPDYYNENEIRSKYLEITGKLADDSISKEELIEI